MYECAKKKIFELRLHFRSKRELIEALALRNRNSRIVYGVNCL